MEFEIVGYGMRCCKCSVAVFSGHDPGVPELETLFRNNINCDCLLTTATEHFLFPRQNPFVLSPFVDYFNCFFDRIIFGIHNLKIVAC